MYVSGGQSDNITQVGCSCEPIIISVSDIRCTVQTREYDLLRKERKIVKRWFPLGNQNLIELDPKVSTLVLQFHQQYHFLESGRDYFSCPRYNLAPSTETKYSAGNLRRSANSRCSPYQEAHGIWLVSERQKI